MIWIHTLLTGVSKYPRFFGVLSVVFVMALAVTGDEAYRRRHIRKFPCFGGFVTVEPARGSKNQLKVWDGFGNLIKSETLVGL